MGFKIKDENKFEDEPFADKWGTYRHFTKVHSDIKDDITSDFILAKLTDNQKESITELVRDAYFCKKEIEKLAKSKHYKLGKNNRFIKNSDGSFAKFDMSEDEQNYIKALGKITFNSYMIKILMITIMYRNIDKNTLIELMTEKEKLENENERLENETANLGQKVKAKLRNQEDEKP